MLIKVLAAEINLSSATNVSNATVVRVVNRCTAALSYHKIADSDDNTIGSLTVRIGELLFLKKDPLTRYYLLHGVTHS